MCILHFFIVDNSMNEKSLDQIGILNFGTNKKNLKMFFILYFIRAIDSIYLAMSIFNKFGNA
jgi:hypothetical protein